MSKFGNAFAQARQEQDDAEIEAYEKSLLEQKEEQKLEEIPAADAEAEAWKKRHGDTRRAWQKDRDEWSRREKELLAQVEQARSSQASAIPVTAEELDAYVAKYPKVGALIQRMVSENVEARLEKYKDRLDEVENLKTESKQAKASALLAELQPDFFGVNGKLPNGEPSIVKRKEFWDWLSDQPQEDQDVMNDGVDARKASRLINDWKMTSGYVSSSKKTKSRNPADAAAAVSTARRPTIADTSKSGDYDFTESQVDRMTAREYEKYEDAIDEARAAGRFLYDLSG